MSLPFHCPHCHKAIDLNLLQQSSFNQQETKEWSLRLKEKEEELNRLKKELHQLHYSTTHSGGHYAGLALELDVAQELAKKFPKDRFQPVSKGKKGADLLQIVVSDQGEVGNIIWEMKNTKEWQESWVEKLQKDRDQAKAQVAIIVSTKLPAHGQYFGPHKNIWFTTPEYATHLALLLRQQLIDHHQWQKQKMIPKNTAEELFLYISSKEVQERFHLATQHFIALQMQLDEEKRSMEKHWAKRARHLEQILLQLSTTHGDLNAICGQENFSLASQTACSDW